MFRLTNGVKYYDWGSTTDIPAFLGAEPDGRPVAEMWMGAHSSMPSRTIAGKSLPDLIAQDPTATLGPRVLQQFGPQLPFLFKMLAAARPLSMQVHPNQDQAKAGYARENDNGVALDAPERSFRDDQHKPELLYALTRFEGLSGFRKPQRILDLLTGLDGALPEAIRTALSADPTSSGIRTAFEHTLAARGDVTREDIEVTVRSCEARLAAGADPASQRAFGTVVALAHWYPGDPGAVASLMLNHCTLEPGDAMFVPAGVVHAYLTGFGLEIMASSDNVLRAGLTPKHVDVAALLDCTLYSNASPSRPALVPGAPGKPGVIRSGAAEFSIAVVEPVPGAQTVYATQDGPRIVLCTRGTLAVRSLAGVELALTQGDSVFVPDSAGRLEFRGNGAAIVAFVP